jgi:nitrogen PTS system EIIA component
MLFPWRKRSERRPLAELAPHEPIVPHAIVLDAHATNAEAVLEAIAAHIAQAHRVEIDSLRRALARREAAASTALGYGFAIPHARVAGIGGPLTLFLRTSEPVPFGAPDGAPVRNFYAIVVPADGDPEAHLQLLASVAATFGDRKFRSRLSCSTTALQVEDAFSSCRLASIFTQS